MGQIARGNGSLHYISGAAVRVYITGTFNGLVRILPLPLGPRVIFSTPHSHLVPNGLDANSCRPKWFITIQHI